MSVDRVAPPRALAPGRTGSASTSEGTSPAKTHLPARLGERLQPVQRRRADRPHRRARPPPRRPSLPHGSFLPPGPVACVGRSDSAMKSKSTRPNSSQSVTSCEGGLTLLALHGRLLQRAEAEPVGLDRVDRPPTRTRGSPAREHGVHAGEVVLDQRVLAVPRRLVADGGRVIALRLARHGDPGEVRHAHRDAERRLPVALRLVARRTEVPVGHPVELAQHAGAAVLVRGALGLLGGGVLLAVAEHVDAGKVEGAVGPHRLAERAPSGSRSVGSSIMWPVSAMPCAAHQAPIVSANASANRSPT